MQQLYNIIINNKYYRPKKSCTISMLKTEDVSLKVRLICTFKYVL